jgi:hypothetical protein
MPMVPPGEERGICIPGGLSVGLKERILIQAEVATNTPCTPA